MEEILEKLNKKLDSYIKYSKNREIKEVIKGMDDVIKQFIQANIIKNERTI